MNYYFDESGNWASPKNEPKLLVLGGLLIKSKSVVNQLTHDINIFKNEHGLRIIHANELNKNQRDELYGIIGKYLYLDDLVVLMRCFHPHVFRRKTNVRADETYIDLASTLVNDLSFGDPKVEIEYDMKFHYSYPKNIISKLNEDLHPDLNRTTQNFNITNKGYTYSVERISKLIENIQGFSQNEQLNGFYQKINYTSEKKQETRERLITKYLWTEFQLRIDGNEKMRNKFKDKIEFQSENRINLLGLKSGKQQIKLSFSNKHIQSVGVQIIDILSNMIWRFGPKVLKTAPASVKNIYQQIKVQDVK